ncbi:HAD family hydrolase [Jannaschia sp. LMIT008]|uniref:HAD family hydrolase n=1 Tax=Jannaschia maritima TaxID=3032585 RepID=UPI002811105D|nr:HAD family hydrolase [Jannaschia sp. LMIT008]
MPNARPHIPRILLAFDFDRTLASDSINAICAAYGVDRSDWERDYEEPLGSHWDEIVRRGQALINMGHARDNPLSNAMFDEAADHIELFPGVMDMPDRLRSAVDAIADGIDLDFVVLSSGYDELISRTPVAQAFDRILASGFEGGDDGVMSCVKRVVGHPAKALYLEALGKGADVDGQNGPERAADYVGPDDMYVPFDQMIYLGDGLSDLQAFEFLHRVGGLTIAVAAGGSFDPGDITAPQRVDAAPPPD